MTKEEFIRKITSRKFWIAVAGFVSGLVIALGKSAETAETISGLIMAGASCVAYIFAEGWTDAANSNTIYLDSVEEEAAQENE